MPYSVGPGGLGSGVDFLASFIAGRNAQQQQNRENSMREQQLAAQMANIREQTKQREQQMQVQQQQLQIEKGRYGLEQRSAGLDPNTGQPFQYQQINEATSQKSSPEHRAAIFHALAAQASRNGDAKRAAEFETQAKDLESAGKTARDEALKFAQFAERQIQDAAQRAHLHAQDAASAAHVAIAQANLQIAAGRLAEEVRNHSITAGMAQERLSMQAAQLGLSLGRFKMEQGRYKMAEQTHAEAESKAPMQVMDDAMNAVKKMGNPQDVQALQDFMSHPENRNEYLTNPKVPDYMRRIFQKLKMYFPPVSPIENLRQFLPKGQ